MVKKSLLWLYRGTLLTLWLVIIVLALSVLTMRYAILPHIDDYKDTIAHHISQAAKQKVSIGEINASWDGLHPHLSLLNVELYDSQNRPALTLQHIEASLSWLSIALVEPRFASIAVYSPQLTIRREADGVIYVAGIAMGGPARPAFANWLIQQSKIDVVDAVVLWQDDLLKAPPLTLNKLSLQIVSPAWEGLLGHHQFGLTATPSAGSSYPIDLRGNLYGKDVSKPNKWRGTVYAKLEGTDIAAWKQWLRYPFDLREGYGAGRFWLELAAGQPVSVTSDVILSDVKARVSKSSPEALLQKLSGRLVWRKHDDGQEISASNIKLATADGLDMHNGKFRIRETLINGKSTIEGSANLDEIRLESVNAFANLFPLPKPMLQKFTDLSPVGSLKNLALEWQGLNYQASEPKQDSEPKSKQGLPSKYKLRSQFIGLGINAYEKIPGFSNLSGSIDADEDAGTVTINSRQAVLDFDDILRLPIPADKLTGQIKWTIDNNKTEIRANNLAISNAHLSGIINASYLLNGIKGGYLDLSGKFSNVNAKYAPYYYPKLLSEHTLNWLDTSILDGHGEDVNVTVKGYLHDFPYPGNKLGLFRVSAKITGGQINYAADWPGITGIKLNMLFEGNRMELNANAGLISGNQISKARIAIPELHAAQPVLEITGEAQGPVSEGIKFIDNSPLLKITHGFTTGLRTSGSGKVNLDLRIPLHDTEASKIKGSYQVTNGSLASEDMAELSKLNGKLEFTESTLRGLNISTWVYGGPAAFNIVSGKDHGSKDNVTRINARGRVSDAGLKQVFGNGWADHVQGSTDWTGNFNIFDKELEVNLNSSLQGIASSLPAPLAKAANESMPLRFEKKHASPSQDTISISLGTALAAKFQRTGPPGALKLDRGEIGLNVVPELPTQPGISFRGTMDYLDFDEWKSILDTSKHSINTTAANKAGLPDSITISKIDMSVKMLDVFDRRINALKLSAKPASDGWQANLQSREISGDVQWHNGKTDTDNGKLSAKLKTLIIPSAVPTTAELRTQGNFKQQQADSYPALDITADNFEFGNKKLGRLELLASEQNEDWSIEKLRIINADSTLSAEGEWHNWKRNPNTRMTISWDINDLGKTLERFGYADTVKGGEADLTGQLKWPGSPHEFDIPGLSGNLQVDARKGQILKIRPGVGRLFSVLSLQNLPRRLTFDFRDVFSSGFTFDKISSSVRIDRGIMRSDDFRMEGPVARVEMRGETDLQKETQHLFVKVTPYISDSLSLAALAGGPVIGAAAYIAQKLLQDPINKLAADEYEITGTWENPQEIKSSQSSKQAVPSASPLSK